LVFDPFDLTAIEGSSRPGAPMGAWAIPQHIRAAISHPKAKPDTAVHATETSGHRLLARLCIETAHAPNSPAVVNYAALSGAEPDPRASSPCSPAPGGQPQ